MSFARKLAAGAALGALAFAFAAPAAHAQQTTAAVRGVAVDDKGAPIAGATITVTHVPSGTDQIVVTNDAGAFDVRGLRVGGPYKITATAKGFASQALGDLFLNVGDAQRVRLALAPASEVSEIVITATKKATTSQLANVGSRTTVGRADIDAVVSVKRDIRDIGRRDPLANLDFVARGTGPSGGLYIAGSAPRANRITIDGVRSADSYGLNTGGLSTNRGPVSFEALEQVSIQAVPFDVEDGDFTGGALNLIMRSGGNDFHGSLFDNYRTTRLVGNELPNVGFVNNDVTQAPLTGYRKVKNKIHESNYGFFLSGPIIKDRLFFAASYEKFKSFDTTGTGPAGAGFANNFNKIPGVSTGAGASQSDIDAVLANWNGYAASSLLKPGAVTLVEPILDEKSSIKIDYNINDKHRLSATYRHAFSSVWKRSPSATSISLDTNWYVQPENEDNYALQLNSRWTPTLSTEARIAFRGYQRGQLPPEGQGFANVTVCTDPNFGTGAAFSCSSGVPSIAFGPDQFRQANVLKTKDTSGSFIANFTGIDHHQIKAGYQFRGMEIYNLFLQAARGVYYFDSVAEFQQGLANQLSYGNSLTGTATDAAAVLNYQVHTLLAQDTWDVNDNLTVNFGVRWDHYAADKKPTLNTNYVNRYGYSNQTTYDGINVVMPRVSAKYNGDWFELSGGFGLVSGGLPDVFLGNSYGGTTGALTNSFAIRRNTNGTISTADDTFVDTATNLPVDPAIGNALLTINKGSASFITNPAAVAQTLLTADSASRRNAYTNSLAPGFKMPSDWKTNVSFKTTQLGIDWGIDAVASWSNVNVAFRDARARALTINGIQQYTPDGRMRYDGLVIAGANAAAINANRAALGLPVASNPDLANLGLFGDIQAYNPSTKNWTRTVALSAHRNLFGVDAWGAYTWQYGHQYGGISEFGTTAGGNTTSGAYYPDQGFGRDPNAAVEGKSNNLIRNSLKLNLSYKFEPRPGWVSRFTLFGEVHDGRPITFLMTDPAGGRNPTFGTSRDDALAYIPNLNSPDAANPLKFVSASGTTVFFDSQASVDKLKALVKQFNLPTGQIVPRGFGKNPSVNRFDFQYAQEIPSPVAGHNLLLTVDIQNVGNLLNRKWGVVKEYTNSRSGGVVVNAQCAKADGTAAGAADPTCVAYRYSYTTASPSTLATPTVDQAASLFSVGIGLKYRF
ncbi:TonB-dependent receptor [Caulobacter sp. SSI4214]|uniref:TonB-dependent receptor n=1 Tax=Caulobacter sp. SSI4214 TaxID=2575739 RepID=UPI00143B479B|nr:TonB-dependent receptor [Caulobacter sp. SSI4214]